MKPEVKKYCDLIKKHTGLTLYKEQIKAAHELCKGNIVDMKTGEGKTLAVFLAMLMKVSEGRKVYVVTSNDYLSERDYNYSKPLLDELGIKSVFFKQSVGGTDDAYAENNVIYATGETLIFDYLRGINAEYDFAIIDEIDYILVESANHDFSVSDGKDNVEMPIKIFKMCKSVADILTTVDKTEKHKKEEVFFDLQYEADVILEHPTRQIEITDSGYKKLYSIFKEKTYNKMFLEILLATLQAKYFYLRDIHYVVEDNEIIVVNDNNGRKSIGGSNDICIQTAIELKENAKIKDKSLLNNTCSYPVFFSIFKTITGISGTTSYVPYDFKIIFNKKVVKVKEHFPNRRKEIFKYFNTDKERKDFIVDIVSSSDTPILVVSASDKRSDELAEILSTIPEKEVAVLDNGTLETETELLENIKRENAVLISSKIVGRGTDISLPERFEEGLMVIITERFFSERAERQIIGRTGRNGKAGTCYVLTSNDDKLFDLEYKDKKTSSEAYIKSLQNRYEQKSFDHRKHIYIRSKLFFDQDKAITDRLKEFSSYEEILEFAKKTATTPEVEIARKVTVRLAETAIENGFAFTKHHNTLLVHKYKKIRPFYQQQFLQYNDNMANTLYNADDFYFRCREYVDIGRHVIYEAINMMLTSIVAESEKNGGVQRRKK